MNNKYLSVNEVNSYIKEIFQDDFLLSNVYISGEISNFTHHSSGHMYFTLKDEKSKISCVMFKTDTLSLKFSPINGQKVLIRGRVSVYERDGKYQVYCKKMDQEGLGDLYMEYEKLKAKLEEEGLFDMARKKSLPFFPKRIGVVTSPTGAVIRDIINVSRQRFKGVDIVLYPATVQGKGAEKTIIEGINCFNNMKDIDVIIIGRGGGSIEELWAFNEEALARAIYASKKPIVSAVGHETDFTISDFVSDYRASTPSHGAQVVVPSYESLTYRIHSCESKLNSLVNKKLKDNYDKTLFYFKSLNLNSPERKIKEDMQYIDSLYDKIISSFRERLNEYKNNILLIERELLSAGEKIISEKKSRYSILLSKLETLSPLNVLKRGYSFTEKEGRHIKSIKAIQLGDILKVNMIDGEVNCQVVEKTEGMKWLEEKKKENLKNQ